MPKITFLQPDGTSQTLDAENNWSIMQVAVDAAVPGIIGECGGAMACATCHCYIHPDWAAKVTAQDNEQSDEERDMLDVAFDVRETSRLGCQIKLNDALDGLIIALPGSGTDW
jgi:ferredoxin, 2Fe-2S